ncbi:MAG: hypothetical protein NTV82_10625 [Candidatus Aminicenantes bacterium]|nr:hypothetical protein [Candidatus Aminicenantes bacterium]
MAKTIPWAVAAATSTFGLVGKNDSVGGRRSHVDIVVADAVPEDELGRRKPPDDLGRKPGHIDDHDIGVLNLLDDFPRRGVFELVIGKMDAQSPAFLLFPVEIGLDVIRDFKRNFLGHASLSKY